MEKLICFVNRVTTYFIRTHASKKVINSAFTLIYSAIFILSNIPILIKQQWNAGNLFITQKRL